MAWADDVADALRNWQVGRSAVLPPPPPALEPGMPSGVPEQGEERPLVSGGKMVRPQQVRQLKYESRWRNLLKVASGFGLDGYPAQLFAALALNAFGPEDNFPDERIEAGTLNVTSTAAQIAQTELFNPANSGAMLVVELISYSFTSIAAANIVQFNYNSAALAVNANAGVRDTRLTGGGQFPVSASATVGLVSQNAAAALPAGASLAFFQVGTGAAPAFVPPIQAPGIVLAPGTGLIVATQTVAVVTMLVTFFWRVRPF